MAQQHAVARAPKMPHCQNCMKKPDEPDASLAEFSKELFADEAEDSGFSLKELLYKESNLSDSMEEADESHGVYVVVVVSLSATVVVVVVVVV